MYARLSDYLAGGGTLAYLGGNGLFDSVTIDDQLQTMTCYGEWSSRTRLFRQLGLPEAGLLGVATPVVAGTTEIGGVQTLQADGNNFPERVAYSVVAPSEGGDLHRFFNGTGLHPYDEIGHRGWYLATGYGEPVSIANSGASGGECDRRDPGFSDVEVLAIGKNSGARAEMTYYDTRHGGFVFSVGSISFGGSLMVDAALQQIVRNALDEALGWMDFNATRYAAIWAQRNGAAWQARHGLSAADYQETFHELLAQGYRLTAVSGYTLAGQDRYAAIWEQREGPAWQARHGLSAADYQRTFNLLTRQGYRLLAVNGFGANG